MRHNDMVNWTLCSCWQQWFGHLTFHFPTIFLALSHCRRLKTNLQGTLFQTIMFKTKACTVVKIMSSTSQGRGCAPTWSLSTQHESAQININQLLHSILKWAEWKFKNWLRWINVSAPWRKELPSEFSNKGCFERWRPLGGGLARTEVPSPSVRRVTRARVPQ